VADQCFRYEKSMVDGNLIPTFPYSAWQPGACTTYILPVLAISGLSEGHGEKIRVNGNISGEWVGWYVVVLGDSPC